LLTVAAIVARKGKNADKRRLTNRGDQAVSEKIVWRALALGRGAQSYRNGINWGNFAQYEIRLRLDRQSVQRERQASRYVETGRNESMTKAGDVPSATAPSGHR
jgi:hypothetical protein